MLPTLEKKKKIEAKKLVPIKYNSCTSVKFALLWRQGAEIFWNVLYSAKMKSLCIIKSRYSLMKHIFLQELIDFSNLTS